MNTKKRLIEKIKNKWKKNKFIKIKIEQKIISKIKNIQKNKNKY